MKKLLVSACIVALTSCAAIKPVARTVNDAALVLCEVFAQENPDALSGMNPKDFCEDLENRQPFIRQVLAAKQELKAELSRESAE